MQSRRRRHAFIHIEFFTLFVCVIKGISHAFLVLVSLLAFICILTVNCEICLLSLRCFIVCCSLVSSLFELIVNLQQTAECAHNFIDNVQIMWASRCTSKMFVSLKRNRIFQLKSWKHSFMDGFVCINKIKRFPLAGLCRWHGFMRVAHLCLRTNPHQIESFSHECVSWSIDARMCWMTSGDIYRMSPQHHTLHRCSRCEFVLSTNEKQLN